VSWRQGMAGRLQTITGRSQEACITAFVSSMGASCGGSVAKHPSDGLLLSRERMERAVSAACVPVRAMACGAAQRREEEMASRGVVSEVRGERDRCEHERARRSVTSPAMLGRWQPISRLGCRAEGWPAACRWSGTSCWSSGGSGRQASSGHETVDRVTRGRGNPCARWARLGSGEKPATGDRAGAHGVGGTLRCGSEVMRDVRERSGEARRAGHLSGLRVRPFGKPTGWGQDGSFERPVGKRSVSWRCKP